MATAQPPAPETPAQQFSIQKIYLRDVSFENPNAPHVYSGTTWEPKMDLGIESSNRKVKEEQYEVVLKVTIEAKIEDKTAYLIEVHQAGIFMARGFDEAGLGPLLGSFCPNILYPYAREAVTSLATNGGFPQLLIEPINFDALYAQSQEQGQAPTTANA
ncbi:MAG: protein-export chaperone SecB [Gammaproteobacteria bacterium]|nr:MAG: protein-export chaperone SecB [Gammaproteobacteria bacterium]